MILNGGRGHRSEKAFLDCDLKEEKKLISKGKEWSIPGNGNSRET